MGDAIGDALRFLLDFIASLVVTPVVAEDLGLDLKEIGLNSGGTTHAPQQRCKPEYQLALHGSSSVIIKGDSRFECFVVLDVFQSDNDGFGSQSVPNCISPRSTLASSVFRTAAPDCVLD